jgi:arsenite-transporting ATPase
VGTNLWIEEMDIRHDVQQTWKSVHAYVASLLNEFGLEETFAEELAILPGMEEVSYLVKLNEYVARKSYDVIVVDCAPTSESLRLLTIPSALDWYIKVSVGPAMRARRQLLKLLTGVPVPKQDYFENLQDILAGLAGIESLLRDGKRTTVRLVTIPERVVMRETQRAFTYFCLSGMTVDGIVVNKVLPASADEDYFTAWRRTQERWLKTIDECFGETPVYHVPLCSTEMIGRELLQDVGKRLYRGRDPKDCFARSAGVAFATVGNGYEVKMALPNVKPNDIEVVKNGDEIVVRVGLVRRRIALPSRMTRCEPVRASLKEGMLRVTLGNGTGSQHPYEIGEHPKLRRSN